MKNKGTDSEKEIELSSASKILCEICNKHFKTKSKLKQHTQTLHKGLRFSCNQCVYQATTQGSLKRHIKSVHEKIRKSNDSITLT